MADRFWVGDGGNWSDNTNHWSASSGGAAGASKPTSSDSVFFDSSSFSSGSQTTTVNEEASCLDMDWTGATNSPTLAGASTLNIYGNLTLISSMSATYSGIMFFKGTAPFGVDFSSLTMVCNIIFGGVGGTWTLQNNYTSTKGLQLNQGTFKTNNKTIILSQGIASTGSLTRRFEFGSSSITTSWGGVAINFSGSNLTLDAGTSIVTLTGTSISIKMDGLTFYDVTLTGTGAHIFSNSATYNILTLVSGESHVFSAGTTHTVSDLLGSGSQGDLTTLSSLSSGTQFNFLKSSGTVSLSYMSIQDSNATGGATWNATDSTNVSGNSGWVFLSSTILKDPIGVGIIPTAR